MRTSIKFLFATSLFILLLGCKTTFNAPSAMEAQQNRQEIYQEIVSNKTHLNELMEIVQNNDEAKMALMENHLKMMESGVMKEMMQNPQMKEKMMAHRQKMMQENPDMQKMMMQKMMENSEMRKKMMAQMQEKMKEKMDENPEMREKMM
ncbi:MAG: hypothetical protein PHG06_21060, partial [Parabacteroides sp.]|nr:hypothetical protein [Parabacteroides sp.]